MIRKGNSVLLNLTKLANYLDRKGLRKEADLVDRSIMKIAGIDLGKEMKDYNDSLFDKYFDDEWDITRFNTPDDRQTDNYYPFDDPRLLEVTDVDYYPDDDNLLEKSIDELSQEMEDDPHKVMSIIHKANLSGLENRHVIIKILNATEGVSGAIARVISRLIISKTNLEDMVSVFYLITRSYFPRQFIEEVFDKYLKHNKNLDRKESELIENLKILIYYYRDTPIEILDNLFQREKDKRMKMDMYKAIRKRKDFK